MRQFKRARGCSLSAVTGLLALGGHGVARSQRARGCSSSSLTNSITTIITVDLDCIILLSAFSAPELLKLKNAITFAKGLKVKEFLGKALPIHALEYAAMVD